MCHEVGGKSARGCARAEAAAFGHRIDSAAVVLQPAVCLGRSKTIPDGYCARTCTADA
jgi:hypothetical protein